MMRPAPCRRVQRRLDDFAAGSLPAGEAWKVQQHLAACAKCAQTLNDFGALRTAASMLEPEAPPPGFEDAVMCRIVAQGLRGTPWLVRFRWAALTAPVALALALGLLVPRPEPTRTLRSVAAAPIDVGVTRASGRLAVAASDPLADLAAANLVELDGAAVGANRDADL
ncbi:MAG: zf-HC2 domain-containing protein [Armatimonadetes bacterium]|nr:zf-HC2 domain-containing protein [Armatimonadota bacterium]